MHYGFNLALDRKDLPVSDSIVDRHNDAVNEKIVNLRNYLMEDESSISAELIAEHLFPEVPCDVLSRTLTVIRIWPFSWRMS